MVWHLITAVISLLIATQSRLTNFGGRSTVHYRSAVKNLVRVLGQS